MAKVQIIFGNQTSLAGFYFVADQFKKKIMSHVDHFLGKRCRLVGYQYGEILLTMAGNFFCGGSRTEDINVLKEKLPQHPDFKLCSPDTVLRLMKELAVSDVPYTSSQEKSYRFNTADRLNGLLLYTAMKSGMLVSGRKYDLDFDHEFLESETWESVRTYKGFDGFSPGCAVLTDRSTGMDAIVGIENRDGNTPVKFYQEDTLARILLNLFEAGVKIKNARMDCGSYTYEVIQLLLEHCDKIFIRAEMCKSLREKLQDEENNWRATEIGVQQMDVLSMNFDGFGGKVSNCRLVVQRQHKSMGTQLDFFEEGGDDVYIYRAILTNDWEMSEEEVIDYYNQRGAKERIFDQMDNDFGWHYLPKGLLKENTVFLILTSIIRNFYTMLLQNSGLRAFGIYATTRMKKFTNRIISAVAKWTREGRQNILKVYTQKVEAYTALFADYG